MPFLRKRRNDIRPCLYYTLYFKVFVKRGGDNEGSLELRSLELGALEKIKEALGLNENIKKLR